MWLALARLETYENAKKVLNRARMVISTDPQIWITAAMLEEAHNNEEATRTIIKRGKHNKKTSAIYKANMIILKAVKSLQSQQIIFNREQWIKEAEKAESSGAVATCQAIVTETIGLGVEDEDRKKTWIEDAEAVCCD